MYGHFILSSGLRSDAYFQCAKVLQYPEYLTMFGEILSNHFKSYSVDKVISPALGGIVLGTEVGRQLGVKTIFCERIDQNMKLRRGFTIKEDEKILIIEDVLSTGGSLKEVMKLVNHHRGIVCGIGVIVDRSSSKIDLHEEFFSVTKQVANIFSPEDIPDSLKNIPPTKPGSKNIDV
jgi:orotate phosphoribosyltransferase